MAFSIRGIHSTMPYSILILSLCSCGILWQAITGQSIKGGYSGVKGGSHSFSTRRYNSNSYSSHNQVQERPIERQHYQQNNAAGSSGSTYDSSYGSSSRNSHGSSYQTQPTCQRPASPMNGRIMCRTSSTGHTCTGKCNLGYKFPDGTDSLDIECSPSSGTWSPMASFPDCSSSSGSSYVSSHQSSSGSRHGSSYQSSSGNTHGSSYEAQSTCESPSSPMNGMVMCQTSSSGQKCTGKCNSGHTFSDGTDSMEIECSLSTGRWSPTSSFPDCDGSTRNGYSSTYQRAHSSGYSRGVSHGSSYSGDMYGHGQSQSERSLCASLVSPMNGQKSCTWGNGQWTCQAICNGGYEFPDGSRQMILKCNDRDGMWLPVERIPDCKLLCHPECENGGSCATHNQCLCPTTHRGNRCQYSIALCDFDRFTAHLASGAPRSECSHTFQYTECRISCDPGMTFHPPTSSMYRCTVDGHWNPPTPPKCVEDSLCETPPPPQNGNVRCQGSSSTMLCSANCMSGYFFPHNIVQLSIQCDRQTGVWSPDVGFPDCEPVCNPPCQNDGKCRGHNACLCLPGFRGGRCQYPISNCDGHDRFASVVWSCKNDEKETTCQISCGHRGTLQPAEHTVYTCSLDGTWQPDLKPICVTDYSQLIDARSPHIEQYTQNREYRQNEESYRLSDSSMEYDESRSGSKFGSHEFGGQQQVDYDFGGQQQVDYDFGGQQQVDYDFGGQQQVDYDFGGQRQDDYNFGGQRQVDYGFGRQQEVEHEFGGQQEVDHEFGGQQQVDHEFGGQQQFDHEFGGQQQIDYDEDFETNGVRVRDQQEPYLEKQTAKENYAQNSVRYEDNVQQQEQNIGSSDKKGDFIEQEEGHHFDLDDGNANAIHGHMELGNGESVIDEFSHIDKVSSYHGICSLWGYHHYRSFDGGLFTFPSPCRYVLASNCHHNDLVISVQTQCDSHGTCERTIGIQMQENRYKLSYDRGLMEDQKSLMIPIHIGELTVERIARYLVARLTSGFTIWINEESTVLIQASPFMKNKTCGMCGNYDGYLDPKFLSADGSKTSDIYTFANSWKQDPDEACVDNAAPHLPCSSDTKEKRLASGEANLVCAAVYNTEFEACSEFIDPDFYYATCQMDCCSQMSSENCECASIGEFFLECSRSGAELNNGWRKPGLCPMICSNGTEYRECGPPCPPTCDDQEPTCQQERCVDGCHCPEHTVLENGQCITADQCPCHHGDRAYASGETVEQDCNTCVCEGGSWICTDSICPAVCYVSGPHYQTFDALNYDFFGICTHYLVESEGFNIQVDYNNNCRELPTLTSVCIRSITIHSPEGAVVKLKQTMEVSVNGHEMLTLPVLAPGVYVGQATSKYIRALLNNGLEIFWDMDASIQIFAPVRLFGKLKGLCGTFTKQQHDDFLTPEGDVEQSSEVFAHKWRVEENCMDLPTMQMLSTQEKPCDKAPQRRPFAERICSVIKGDEFKECHFLIDYQMFYEECMEDICGCMSEPNSCSCQSLANYATACARKGKSLSWRKSMPACGIPCPMGQIYLACADPCSYTCSEIAHSYANCREVCVEGCACPPGQTLDNHGRCVAVSTCSCVHSGHMYPPDFMQRRGREMCECSQGQWACHEASSADILLTPPPHVATDCDATENKEFTDCLSDCPLTCSNLYHHQPCTTAVCQPGCRCKKGFILDTSTERCVQPTDCPCHHSGKSYEEGEQVVMDCHECTCESGMWSCDNYPCPGLCSAWGDSHYETFDGRLYDFDGSCDYVMVKAHPSESVVFSVVIQNVPCGAGGGATCGKSLFITLGKQSITLTKDHPLPDVPEKSRLSVSSVGLFTLVETDIGISIQWNHNTKVYVTAQPIWENKLQGLCGDFNGDSSDDFRSPSGGVPLVLAKDFADSWRVHKYCKPASQTIDNCDKNPERRTWSKHKCAVLKSELFKPCHYQVEVEEYFKRCVLDSCACNSGGDCECLCAVVSAYAQKCARRGVEIEWRSQELCPIQCESCDRYSPCISLCSPPNCDTYLDDSTASQSCSRQPCVDGCEPKPCEMGYVYQSANNLTCIPEQFCTEKPCTVIDGVPYREGQQIENADIGDACQSCYCTNGDVECVGVPCTSAAPKPTIGLKLEKCEFTGWTEWINSVDPIDENGNDFESLQDLVSSNRIPCPLANITSIECRVASTEEPSEASEDVICNIEDGLKCESSKMGGVCEDYELRVYCQCHEEVTCPLGQEWNSCAFNCAHLCHSMETYLLDEDECTNYEDCVPGCIKEVCTFPKLTRDAETCVTPDMCTCRHNSGKLVAPGEVLTDGCQKCQCLNNTLKCSTILECKEIEKELPPSLLPEETYTYETYTLTHCQTGWSEWKSLHIPDRQGEAESLEDLKQEGFVNCDLEQITRVQCRDIETLRTIKYTRDRGIYCDLTAGGVMCKNKNMPNGEKCADFEIRAYCDCEKVIHKGHELIRPVTSTVSPTTIITITVPSHVTMKKQPAVGIMTTTPSCSYWSDWINKNRPRRGRKHGEKEDTKFYILKQTEGFCLDGYVSDIECREVNSDLDYLETKEEKLVCAVNKGFQCLNKNQPDRRCKDYKIRYLCSCGEESPAVSLFIKPTSPSYIYPCSELIPLISGLKPIPDSQIKASSSESYKSGPDAIRMKSYETGKAWTAAETNAEQFVEVDLGDVRAIYGITTKGKHDTEEWVTSYQLLYSIDGASYSYYQDEDDNNKIFSGNYDDNTEVKHIFQKPFEARYVRVEPLSWEEKISLRMDLMGCAEAITTTIAPRVTSEFPARGKEEEEEREETVSYFPKHTTTTTERYLHFNRSRVPEEEFKTTIRRHFPFEYTEVSEAGTMVTTSYVMFETPEISEEEEEEEFIPRIIDLDKSCKVKMGLENGLLMDGQLSASSSYSSRFSPEFARLGSESVWAAEVRDDKQYLQVDFVDPQRIAGVITKGREDIPQWVTAYIVEYSKDGETWHTVMNEDGDEQEFSANYDAYSEVENLFPKIIRARFIRIRPIEWKNWISMQIEVLGCYHPEACRDPMGMDHGVVTDHQLTASSEISESLSAENGRLSSTKAWTPKFSDKDPFIQVDLLQPTNLTAVVTKGNPDLQQWVESFYVAYSNDSENWKKVENARGRAKEFSGNTDQDSAVINLFPIPITGRYVRVIPLEWHKWISLRFELLGCFHEKECLEPMGLENGVLSDAQITSSSSSDLDTLPSHARINGESGWQPNKFDKHPYLQVDFLEDRNVSAVVTKGIKDTKNWVTRFKIVYSFDGKHWYPIITDDGDDVQFDGNTDSDTPVVNVFPDEIEARYFRVVPLAYENEIGLRLEILGCYHPYECQEPMGIESGSIFDFQISASSYLSDELSPLNARLDSDTAWVAETDDDDPFIQIDFMEIANITGLMTRGRNDANEWVKEYKILHSMDGDIYLTVSSDGKPEKFQANYDSESSVTNIFPEPISARFLKILPMSYERRAAMRLEVIGCHHETECKEPMGLENGLLLDSHLTASSYKSGNADPSKFRLNSDASWSPDSVDEPQYVQVDFGDSRNISAVVTKGDPTDPMWITAYQVAYSEDGDTWTVVEDPEGDPIDFPGNTDNDSPVINVFPEIVQAQYIRLMPTNWQNWIALRAEILGCYHAKEEPELEVTTLGVPAEVLQIIGTPTEPTLVALCPDPMESEISLLTGSRIKASSSTPNGGPSRILLQTHAAGGKSGGWVPKVNDLHPVLHIEFSQLSWLTSIYIQGREDEENWVKTLRVFASLDNTTWSPVFGPNGDEVIHGNEDQHKIVGHFFKKPTKAKFVKIIPETWHRWPSFRLDLKGCPISKVTTTELPYVTEHPELCPELINHPQLTTECPDHCPDGQLCDGRECVDPVDCSCVHDRKIFKVGDRMVDFACSQCDCALDGHTMCKEKKCEPCEEGQATVLTNDCTCICEKCGENERMCPSNKECIPEDMWCDGVVDCPDDETNCQYSSTTTRASEIGHPKPPKPISPGFPRPTTKGYIETSSPSYAEYTSTAIPVPTTLPSSEKATCEVLGKHINTFDGQDIALDVCNHVAMKDIRHQKFNVTIHKECGFATACKQRIEIHYQKQQITVHSDLTVKFNGHSYTTGQLWRLSRKTGMNLVASKVGEQVIVKSLIEKFTITYNVRGELKIEVPSRLKRRISGLCGYYSDKIGDDQRKPSGLKAFTSQEFKDSWAVDGKEKECKPLICPHEEMKKSLELCHKLKEDSFIPCGEILPLNQFIEFCMSSTCECLLNEQNSENKCKCDSLQPLVEACENKLGPFAVRNWRLIHECHKECPSGMEWNDCGPSCQLTCDSASMDMVEECSGKCVPGCFCPAGTVLNGELCVHPDQCADQVCQGFGDPHFQTFDGLSFPFQGVGSFLIVSDNENNFVVKGLSQKCGLFNPTTCLVGMEITYKQHKIVIQKRKTLKVDGKKIPIDNLPMHNEGIVILGYPGRTFVVAIPRINLEARYHEENSGFAVRVPSRKYFNKTKGLCGNCNGRQNDELDQESLNDYICSWQTDGDREKCMKSLDELPEMPEKIPICDKLQDPVFAACHPLVDVDVFVDACSFDATYSGDNKASLCKTAMEYGRQCCQAGIVVEGWPEELACDIDCPSGMQYKQCHKGCPQTCVTLKNDSNDPSCNQVETDGCFCPEGKVLKNETCVDAHSCETCDEEGHMPGDTWKDSDCKRCHCRHDLRIECVMEICNEKPLCSKDEILAKRELERETLSCCETYVCVPKKEDCPPAELPHCKKGEVAKFHSGYDDCQILKCECEPLLCPPIVWPEELEEGQRAVQTDDSCCPTIKILCDDDSCPNIPDCEDGLELIKIEGECCNTYKCKPPKDACVYTHAYKVVNGIALLTNETETNVTFYEPGEQWNDGPCEKCSCVESKGQYAPLCTVEHCSTLEDMPENMDYVFHEMKIPNKCCPDIFKIKCRDEDGNIYEAGEQWQDEDDPCVTYLCEQEGSDVVKIKSIINCTECPKTAILFPPSKKLGQCCGLCKINKCEDGEELYNIGDTWESKDDECIMAECISEFGNVKTVYTKLSCPTIPQDCPQDNIINDSKGCCRVCNLTSELSCSTGPIPEEDTIGFFTYNEPSQGGICVNNKPVAHILQCKGACHSRSYYSLEDGDFKDTCKCCKVNITVNRTIELQCPNGNYIHKTFLQPESCQCSKCAPKPEKKNDFGSQTWVQQNQWEDESNYEPVQKPFYGGRFTEQKPHDDWQFQQNSVQQQEDYDF